MTALSEAIESASVPETGKALMQRVESDQILISEVVETILHKAVVTGTSDVHIEPTRPGVRVRYRIDGVFQELALLPPRLHEPVIARIKVLAELIQHRKELSQEGRIRVDVEGRRGDFRVSIIPTVAGEKVVLRLFNVSWGLFNLDELGYHPDIVKRLEQLLFDMSGMVVLTGPSGSGKTTTLYASLQRIHEQKDDYASMCTIEDPVEYEFGRFSQIQVNRKVGLDFAKILAAVLRQDPEVIMIGEIRDTETCEIALRAGLTGHLVLTTIHSGSACEVVTRLLNMDIEAFVVASALTGVVAQRLVRKVCEECAHTYTPARGHIEFVEQTLGRGEVRFMKGRGCRACAFTGFKGRVPVAELLVFDDNLRSLVLERPSTASLKRFAVGRGMRPLLEDGLEKVAAGQTTLEEILRVIGTGGSYK